MKPFDILRLRGLVQTIAGWLDDGNLEFSSPMAEVLAGG
jgi:hypothetical protein